MNLIVISTYSRPLLLQQTIHSLLTNAADRNAHHLTVVFDLGDELDDTPPLYNEVSIVTCKAGASRARNIGAGSIPKYLRHDHVLFCDDDIFAVKNYDAKLLELAAFCDSSIISGYSHPYNNCTPMEYRPEHGVNHGVPLVISSVAMMMPWGIWDAVGPFDEPGGASGSEDYAISMRAKAHGFGFAVCDPQVILHAGLISSTGKQIVGYKELAEQNDRLLDVHGIRGKVRFE